MAELGHLAWAIGWVFSGCEYEDNRFISLEARNQMKHRNVTRLVEVTHFSCRALRRWLLALLCVFGVHVSGQAFAAAESVAALLSPRVAGMSLTELQKRLGAMECAIGPAGAKDCFIALPFGAANRGGGNEETRVFLRARGGHVGQVIINGPVEQLTRVLAALSLHYGAPKTRVSRVSAALAPCTELSQWQHEGQSVLVKVCRNPVGNGGGDFVVNILADWYALSR